MDPKNIGDLCRVCASDSNLFMSIHDQHVFGKLLHEIINDLCPINVCPGDGLPEFVCPQCHWQLFEFQRFREKSLQGQDVLTSIKMGMDQVSIKEEPLDVEDDGVTAARFPEPVEVVASKYCDEDAEEILPDGGTMSCSADRIPKVEIVESIDYKAFVKIEPGSDGYEEGADAAASHTSSIEDDSVQEEEHWNGMDSVNDGKLPCTSRLTSEESGMSCSELLKLAKVSHPLLSMPCRKTRGRAPSIEASPSTLARLEARRCKARLRRQQETPEQHEKRLKKLRDGQKQRIARESPEERALRLHRLRLNQETCMAVETPVQREERLQKMRLSQSKRLARESREKREERLLQLRLNQVERLAGITQGNRRRIRGRPSMGRLQYREGIMPEGNLGLICSGAEADGSRTSAKSPMLKASMRLSKGSCKYNEEQLGLPLDFIGTFEELLGPEEELKFSVERKRKSKCSLKNLAVVPPKEAEKTNVVTHDESLESHLVKNPSEVTSPDSESHARKNSASNSIGVVKDLPGVNELFDNGSNRGLNTDKQVIEPLKIRLNCKKTDRSSELCTVGAIPAVSGINDPSIIRTESSETMEHVTSLNCGRGPSRACVQFNKDLLLGGTGKGLPNIDSAVPACDEVFTPRQLRSLPCLGNVNANLKKSRPKRKSCGMVNYSEDAVIRNANSEVSGAAEDQFTGTSDVGPEQSIRQEKQKEKGCSNTVSSVDNGDYADVAENQTVCGPDLKLKQQASQRKLKDIGCLNEALSEGNSEVSEIVEKLALIRPGVKLKQLANRKKWRIKCSSNAVAGDGNSEVSEVSGKQIVSGLTLNLKQHTSRRKLRKKDCYNAEDIEGNSKFSDTISDQIVGETDLRLTPLASQEKPMKKHCPEIPDAEEGSSALESQTLVATAVPSQAVDVWEGVASPSHLKAQDSDLGVIGQVFEPVDGEVNVLESTEDNIAKLIHSSRKMSSKRQSSAKVVINQEPESSIEFNTIVESSLSSQLNQRKTVRMVNEKCKAKSKYKIQTLHCKSSVEMSSSSLSHLVLNEPCLHDYEVSEVNELEVGSSSKLLPDSISKLGNERHKTCRGTAVVVHDGSSRGQDQGSTRRVTEKDCDLKKSHRSTGVGGNVSSAEVLLNPNTSEELNKTCSNFVEVSEAIFVESAPLFGSVPASDTTVSSRFNSPSEILSTSDVNGQKVEGFSPCDELVADMEKVIGNILPEAVGSGVEVTSLDDIEIHTRLPSVDVGRCSKSFSTLLSGEVEPRMLQISGNDNGFDVSSVSSGIDHSVGSRKQLSGVENESSLPTCDNTNFQLKLSVGHEGETFECLDKAFESSVDDEASGSRVSLGFLLPDAEMQNDKCHGEELDNYDSADITKDIDSFLCSIAMGNGDAKCVDRVRSDKQCPEENGVPSMEVVENVCIT